MHVEERTADEGVSVLSTAEAECCQVVDSDSLLPERPNVLINLLTGIEVPNLPVNSACSVGDCSPIFLSSLSPPLKLLGQLRI